MIKSKHFRKDVIMARVIVLVALIVLVVGASWIVSAITKPQGNITPSGSSELELPSSEKESESESATEPDSNTEPETGSQTEPENTQQPTEEPSEEPAKKYYVQTLAKDNLKVRVEPNTKCDTLGSVPYGTKLEFVEKLDGWYKVIYKGKVGYVSAQYSKLIEE